jgi:hypothetical protein
MSSNTKTLFGSLSGIGLLVSVVSDFRFSYSTEKENMKVVFGLKVLNNNWKNLNLRLKDRVELFALRVT